VSALLIGSQRPSLLAEPEATDFTLSDIALEFAAEAGYVLDGWQRWLVRWSFARRPDKLWAARDVGAEVARQNGKNIWLEVVELVSLLYLGDRLITHSAHRADTSHEHFVSLKEHIEASDFLMEQMPRRANNGFVTSHGLESIEFGNGARLQFKARMTSSGRGPRPQKVIFDEALVLTHDRVGSMAPGISAQRNPQLIFASSPPRADSEVLHELRKRAHNPEPGERLFYAAWNNPPDTDPEDREAWYRANPSLGMGRLTEESLNANRRMMVLAEFVREHLGVPEEPEAGGGVVDLARWESLSDADSLPADSTVRLALDAPPDRKSATFSTAGKRSDGLLHVQLRFHCRPTQPGDAALKDRVVDMALKLSQGHSTSLILPPSSPARAWKADLLAAGVSLDEMTPAEYAEACGRITNAIDDGALRHRGQPEMNNAVAGLAVRSSGDVDAWSRRNSSANIAPFVAATCALVRVPDTAPSRGLFLAVT
jgi:phage terminase large subunit-like protein